MWVTLRRKTFNHGSTSNSPPPPGEEEPKPATDGRPGIIKIIVAHRAGQWKSFPLDLFFPPSWWVRPCCSRNPITGTQCLQPGINPTVHSPCLSPGEAGGSDWSGWSGVERASLLPHFFLAAAALLQGNITGQMCFQWSHLEMTVWDRMMVRSTKIFI